MGLFGIHFGDTDTILIVNGDEFTVCDDFIANLHDDRISRRLIEFDEFAQVSQLPETQGCASELDPEGYIEVAQQVFVHHDHHDYYNRRIAE